MAGRMETYDHVHQWVPHTEDALGFYEKRKGVEPFACRGRVFACADTPCEVFLFVPHNKDLSASEAVLTQSFAQTAAA